jgi:hypothetical protein
MGYDRLWIEFTEHPRGLLERREAAKKNLSDEFDTTFGRLYAQGHFVVLIAGKNHLFDELFLFEDAAGAHQFYERGFRKWESFIGDNDEGCGFQEVSLYREGHLVNTKSCAPTKWAEANGTVVTAHELGFLPDESDVAEVEFNDPKLMRPKYPAQEWERLCQANGWTGMDCESTQLRGEELVEDGIQHALEKREEL